MPNLEYSVRFVLASDSTSEIDQALAKMRDTGSTITVKVNADVGSFTAEMAKVKSEIEKVESSTEKLSRSTSKGSGLFKLYAKEIRSALNEFRATGDLTKAQATFAGISARVDEFGNSMRDSAQGMQEFYTLTNQITSATAVLNREQNNSAGVIKANEAVQRALNEETKKSAQILRTNAQARVFDARQVKQSAQQVRDEVSGQIALLRRLAVQGRGTAEEISIAFQRTAKTEEELTVTTEDLTQAFLRQQKAVEGSRMSFKNKQETINKLLVAEDQSTQSMRKVNSTLGQQENQVGDVSYAMVSFTRLLEDMPYGFRGFANNIQPTVYGLIQLNDKTNAAALAFRKMHNKEMPLAQRAMINFKSALSSPINQLLLLTSVIAVAGTMIERWVQSARKGQKEAASLSEGFLGVFDAIKGQDVLDTDYSQAIEGLELYSQALQSVIDIDEQRMETATNLSRMRVNVLSPSFAGDVRLSEDALAVDERRLEVTKGLSAEAKKKLTDMKAEVEVQKVLLENEQARYAIYLAQLKSRDRTDAEQLNRLQDEIQIERVRQASGEEAAVREKARLAIERLKNDEFATENGLRLINLQLEMDLLRIKKDEKKEVKEIRNEYDGILLSLQRQLQDEMGLGSLQVIRISQQRELADLVKTVAERRSQGEEISLQKERALYGLVTARYDLIEAREERASRRAIQGLLEQNQLLEMEDIILDTLLRGDYERANQLDFRLSELEYQNSISEMMAEISEMTFESDEERNRLIEIRTGLLEREYQIKLKNQVLDARDEVSRFLAPDLNPIDQIIANRNRAQTASTFSFLAEQKAIEQQYANDAVSREQALTDMYARQEAERIAIALRGTQEIQAIKTRGYIEGSMMIVSALEQLNQSSEATNKKAFERQKQFAIGLATINTLLAITQVLADDDIDSTFLKYAQAAAMAAIGFAQVNQIRSTQYGSAGRGAGASGLGGQQRQSYGFTEVDMTRNASAGVGSATNQMRPVNQITVIGNVDREGIAFAVRDGEDIISSRAIF